MILKRFCLMTPCASCPAVPQRHANLYPRPMLVQWSRGNRDGVPLQGVGLAGMIMVIVPRAQFGPAHGMPMTYRIAIAGLGEAAPAVTIVRGAIRSWVPTSPLPRLFLYLGDVARDRAGPPGCSKAARFPTSISRVL